MLSQGGPGETRLDEEVQESQEVKGHIDGGESTVLALQNGSLQIWYGEYWTVNVTMCFLARSES